MAQALALHSRDLATELRVVLCELDRLRRRAHLESPVRESLEVLRRRLAPLVVRAEALRGHAKVAPLHEQLQALAVALDQHMPRPGAQAVAIRERWGELRVALVPHYERLANSLSAFDIHVPALRPSNHMRSLWHAMNGILVVALIQWVFTTPREILWASLFFASLAWSMELSRRYSPGANRFMMRLFKHVSHPHEEWRINSATWYCTALLCLGILGNVMAASIAAAVLGMADPAAAWVGRRWGQVRLVNGRTLEGSLAFMVVGTTSTLVVMLLFYPDVYFSVALPLALVAGVAGAVVELFCRRVDDNLAIPIGVALSVLGTLALMGA